MFVSRFFQLVGLLAVVTLCGALGLFDLTGGHEIRDGYSEYAVPMVDPGGRDPQKDLLFSQANLFNSEANVNNAEAQKYLAQATAIVAQSSYDDPLYVHKTINSESESAFNRGMMFVVGGIFLFVAGFVVIGMFRGSNDKSLARR